MQGRNMTRWRDPKTDPRQEKKSNVITPQGYARMKGTADYLRRVKRPDLSRKTGEAAAMGDRSENADYTYNKKELNQTIARIAYLERRLDELTVVDRLPTDQERVYFAAFVTLENEQEEEMEIRIVGPDETDNARRWISIDAPLAKALLGKRLDDEVSVAAPGGVATYLISDIRYLPPAS